MKGLLAVLLMTLLVAAPVMAQTAIVGGQLYCSPNCPKYQCGQFIVCKCPSGSYYGLFARFVPAWLRAPTHTCVPV